MPTKQKRGTPEIKINDNLPTLHIDGINIKNRNDGCYLIRFTVNLPEGSLEQVRLMINEADLKGIMNALCQVSNYYPEKPSDIEEDHTQDKS